MAPSMLPLASVWPLGAERHRIDRTSTAGLGLAERVGVRGIGDIPQPDRAGIVAGGQGAAVGGERHGVDEWGTV